MQALGGKLNRYCKPDTSVGAIVHSAKYSQFGYIVGRNQPVVANSMNQLHSNSNLFSFYSMDIQHLITGSWRFTDTNAMTPMSWSEFDVLYHHRVVDWRLRDVGSVSDFKQLPMQQSISNCLCTDNVALSNENAQLKQEIVTLKQQLIDQKAAKDDEYQQLRNKFKVSYVFVCSTIATYH